MSEVNHGDRLDRRWFNPHPKGDFGGGVMNRAERDAMLAVAAERYVGLLRLQRGYLAAKEWAAAAALGPARDAVVDEMTILVDVPITPAELSKQEP